MVVCFVSLPRGGVGLSIVCGCSSSWSCMYSLVYGSQIGPIVGLQYKICIYIYNKLTGSDERLRYRLMI